MVLGVRPTAFSPANGDGRPTITVTPKLVEELGDERYVIFDLAAARVDTDATRAAGRPHAESVPPTGGARAVHRPAARRRAGERRDPLTLAIDPRRLHFFDPATGLAR